MTGGWWKAGGTSGAPQQGRQTGGRVDMCTAGEGCRKQRGCPPPPPPTSVLSEAAGVALHTSPNAGPGWGQGRRGAQPLLAAGPLLVPIRFFFFQCTEEKKSEKFLLSLSLFKCALEWPSRRHKTNRPATVAAAAAAAARPGPFPAWSSNRAPGNSCPSPPARSGSPRGWACVHCSCTGPRRV